MYTYKLHTYIDLMKHKRRCVDNVYMLTCVSPKIIYLETTHIKKCVHVDMRFLEINYMLIQHQLNTLQLVEYTSFITACAPIIILC